MADPSGTNLCSGTTDGDTLPSWGAGYEEREISFGAGAVLTSGNEYAIVVKALTAILDNGALVGITSSGTYANGVSKYTTDAGSNWSDWTGFDWWFKTKAGAVVKDQNLDAPDGTDDIYGDEWAAQTFVASETYTITSVVLKMERFNFGGSTGTVTVSIQATGSAPTKATTPTPANAATDTTLDQATLTWVDGGGATSYNIYYGTQSGNLTLVSSGQVPTSFTITGISNGSPFSYLITRYWRIDSVNDDGTTTGDEWSFTTIRLNPPTVTYFYSAGNYYYQLLVQADGTYGDPPPTGAEDTDYVIVTSLPNAVRTQRKLVAIAKNALYYEDV